MKLELLFSKKPMAKLAEDESAGAHAEVKKKKKRSGVLDTARMQNLAIGLRSFKDLEPKAVASMVGALAVDDLSAEQLARLDEMLPTDAEVKLVEGAAKALAREAAKEAKEAEATGDAAAPCTMLEPAEEFVLGFAAVPRPKPKLAVLTFMKTLGVQALDAERDLGVVARAVAQVVSSRRLAHLLSEVHLPDACNSHARQWVGWCGVLSSTQSLRPSEPS
jgi:hypothetical protein